MEKRLEWTVHKAFPIPILLSSTILGDSLYLYGVDFMSTKDVEQYFERYSYENENQERSENFKVKWINDSSCVV